ALGVTDQEIAAGQKELRETLDELFLRGPVKVDHHVPAEDDLEWFGEGIVAQQVDLPELYPLPQLRLHPVEAVPLAHTFLKTLPPPIGRQGTQTILRID